MNKTAFIKTEETKIVRRALIPGDGVFINHSLSRGFKEPFTVQSVAKDIKLGVPFTVYVFVSDNRSTTGSTIIATIGSGDDHRLLSDSVYSVNIHSIDSRDCAAKDKTVDVDGNNVLSFSLNKREKVERPVAIGDILKTERRTYQVEYIAKDGSLLCRMYSRKDKDAYQGMIVIDGVDRSLMSSLYTKVTFK
ncbi:hypothetical protein RB16p126 [Escherichia phage RB16]|uniref:Conserved hypothetical phage protein n=1 Tax=Escherichia phage RB16 TaxID=2681599 RepID=D9ICI7_BPRB1|nr:hypothetical protein RB16p126 [Escherichia phage RB16]ADJ55430.1 conserved hypothetical phage protein [Escherichia phage RB16]